MTGELVLALVSAAVGATGAITAQVVGEIFNGRRERRRLNWENKRHTEDSTFARAQRFEDAKRELYSEYLRVTYPSITAAQRFAEGQTYPEVVRKIRSFDPEFESQLESLRWEISLIGDRRAAGAVELSYVYLVLVLLQVALDDEWTPEHRQKTAHQAFSAWMTARDAMRADLAGDEAALDRVAKQSVGSTTRAKSDGARRALDDLKARIAKRQRAESPGPGSDGN
jgi:hypothetical protein